MPYKDPEKRREFERERSKRRSKDPKRRQQEAERQRRRRRQQAAECPSKMPRFVSVDGEDLDGRYSLLAASTGDSIHTPGRDITIGEACAMLLRIAQREREPGRRVIPVGYSVNYDIQRLLRTLPLMQIAAALDGQMVEVRGPDGERYVIRYLPRKVLEVIQRGGTATRLYDVHAFFQQSFLQTCEAWIPDYKDEIALMVDWKARRGTFREADREEIARYNDTENRCLDEVMRRLFAAFERLGLPPPIHPWGPGAVADTALGVYGMLQHHSQGDDYPEEVQRLINHAYFGGRAQVLQVGEFPEAYDYDLHSAYPAAIAYTLASARGEWREQSDLTCIYDTALYAVRWDTPRDNPVTPFPFRATGGKILYPHAGEGVYWGVEARAAVEAFGREHIEITKGWLFEPEDADCWAWYAELADTRVEAKKRGERDLERVAKLILNSVYGKTAQTSPAPGRWTSLMWAGMITAFCRARLLDLASQRPDAIIFMATDGLMSTEPLVVANSNRLGDWGGGEEAHPLFVIQPGVYLFGSKSRTRGFRAGDWTAMRRQWREEGRVVYEHSHTRYVTLQEGLSRGDPSIMGTWEDATTVYQSLITVEPGTPHGRVPPAPARDYPSLPHVRGDDSTERVPKGYEYRWKAALILLGRPRARSILREQGIDAVIQATKDAEGTSKCHIATFTG